MSKDNPLPQQSEEVDLGQLFRLIGSAFERFFAFIGKIFQGLFRSIVLFLLFIQKHLVKLVVIGVLGLIIGFYLDFKMDTRYTSSMVVEPNFNSVQQLYNNVNFYNELAEAEDSLGLSQAFSISIKEATSIREFKVESYSDENQKVQLFDKFVRSLDTTTQKAIDMKAYLENFNSLDARFHTVSVIATDNSVAKKIQPAIISSISRNDYFNLQKDISDINLELQKTLYNKQIAEIDSLQMLYKRVMLKEAERSVSGTNISLGEDGAKQNKELSLLNKMDELKSSLVALNEERANKSSILNVISDFPKKGVRIKGLINSYKFRIPALFIGLTFLVLGLLSLNRFINKYTK